MGPRKLTMNKHLRSIPSSNSTSTTSLLPKPIRNLIKILVILLVLYYELGVFYNSVSQCKWDDSPSSLSFSTSTTNTAAGTTVGESNNGKELIGIKPFHTLILADPQLIDMRSYPGRSYVLKKLTIWITDLYAKKSWWFVTKFSSSNSSYIDSTTSSSANVNDKIKLASVGESKHGIDSIIWLGDLLDSGVSTVDPIEHSNYVHRFHSNFPLPSISTSSTIKVPTILIPGNHDLGLHLPITSLATFSRIRFEESFGPVNGLKVLGGWEFVWVDSMALLEAGSEGDGARQFVSYVSSLPSTLPRILLTHIPLYRVEGTLCGESRESPRTLKQGAGKNYQNEMDQGTSEWLLRALAPRLVYSGDDHDSCIINHPFSSPTSSLTSIKESTIKAFSMAMGVRRPGYHLLSTYPPIIPATSSNKEQSVYTQINCELPDQLGIWLHVYLSNASILFVLLFVSKLYSKFKASRSSNTYNNGLSNQRRVISAKSNGLPIHTHKKSISRSFKNFLLKSSSGNRSPSSPGGSNRNNGLSGLGMNGNSYSDEEEQSGDDEEGIFPTFSNGNRGGNVTGSGEYNHSIENDESNSPTSPSSSSPSSYYSGGYERNGANAVNGNGSRRKLSRVWSKGSEWEKGELENGSFDTMSGKNIPDSTGFFSTIFRSFFKPFQRQVKKLFNLLRITLLFNLFKSLLKAMGLGLIWECAKEVGSLISLGVLVWLGIALWFYI